jgi:DNA-directed RNA polymerase specialized sigma24 family protein
MLRFPRPLPSDSERPAPAVAGRVDERVDELLELARAAGGGNPDAAATLIMHLGSPMLSVVRRVMGRQNADVDDVAQDAVIALLNTLATFRGECRVVHFAQRIALLTALTAPARPVAAHRARRARRRESDRREPAVAAGERAGPPTL